jgi:hypothetical protein
MSNLSRSSKNKTKTISLPYDLDENVEAITVKEIQQWEQFRDWPEDKLQSLIDTIRTFTEIVFAVWSREQADAENTTKTISVQSPQSEAA